MRDYNDKRWEEDDEEGKEDEYDADDEENIGGW